MPKWHPDEPSAQQSLGCPSSTQLSIAPNKVLSVNEALNQKALGAKHHPTIALGSKKHSAKSSGAKKAPDQKP